MTVLMGPATECRSCHRVMEYTFVTSEGDAICADCVRKANQRAEFRASPHANEHRSSPDPECAWCARGKK